MRQGDVMGSGFWASFRSLGELKGSLFKEMVFELRAKSGKGKLCQAEAG